MIYMDVHEKGEIQACVKDACNDVQVEPLNAGDYLVDNYLCERKRWNELAGRFSTSENDLYTQLLGVVATAEEEDVTPVLLLEGDMYRDLSRTNMSLKYIFKRLVGVFKMGIFVFISPDREMTAYWLSQLEKDATSSKPQAIRNSPKVPKDDWDRYLIEGFDGVGPATATSILEQFETVQIVMNAEIDELKEVDGVGTKTAEKIYYTARGRMSEL